MVASRRVHTRTDYVRTLVCVCWVKSWQRRLDVSFPGTSFRPALSYGGITGSSPAADGLTANWGEEFKRFCLFVWGFFFMLKVVKVQCIKFGLKL